MPDLDARIRAKLEARATDPDFLRHRQATDALRAVLDWLTNAEEFGDQPDPDDCRTVIARALGVDAEEHCPYTHAHTRAFCGRPNCREN